MMEDNIERISVFEGGFDGLISRSRACGFYRDKILFVPEGQVQVIRKDQVLPLKIEIGKFDISRRDESIPAIRICSDRKFGFGKSKKFEPIFYQIVGKNLNGQDLVSMCDGQMFFWFDPVCQIPEIPSHYSGFDNFLPAQFSFISTVLEYYLPLYDSTLIPSKFKWTFIPNSSEDKNKIN